MHGQNHIKLQTILIKLIFLCNLQYEIFKESYVVGRSSLSYTTCYPECFSFFLSLTKFLQMKCLLVSRAPV